MRILIPFLSLILAHVATAAEEPAELVELRQGWEEARGTKQQRVDKLYFEELEELKKNFVKAGNIEAARAVDSAIKDSEKAGNEPQALLNMRDARGKSLKKAFTPIDKRYWKDLKKLREDFQKQGSLAGIEVTDAEIEKVLAAYKKSEPPKKKAAVVKEKAGAFDGKWKIMHLNSMERIYIIKDGVVTVVSDNFGNPINDTAKLKKHEKGWMFTFKRSPTTEYIFQEGDRVFIHHWMRSVDPLKEPYSHAPTITKIEETADE